MIRRFSRPRLKPWLRKCLLAGGLLAALLAGWSAWVYLTLPDVTPLKNRGETITIKVPDWQGREHPFLLGPKNPHWTPLSRMPEAMKWAVIVAEDANFFEHEGVDVQALQEALKYDLQQKRLARGASTITQQLAKNLYLSRDRHLLRKLKEVLIARRLEESLTKGRILELYLNVVELGPMVYGVGHGARYHFGQSVSDLGPAGCATLAAILPGPRVAYNPRLKPVKVQKRAKRILRRLRGRRVLTAADYAAAVAVLEGRPAEPPEEETPAEEREESWADLGLEAPDLSGEPALGQPVPFFDGEEQPVPSTQPEETAIANPWASDAASIAVPVAPESAVKGESAGGEDVENGMIPGVSEQEAEEAAPEE